MGIVCARRATVSCGHAYRRLFGFLMGTKTKVLLISPGCPDVTKTDDIAKREFASRNQLFSLQASPGEVLPHVLNALP